MTDTYDPASNYVRRGLELFAGYGEAEALVANDGRRFSFAELRSRILATAALLWEHGIRPGMTIGNLISNPAESHFIMLGAHLLGCRTVWMASSTPKAFLTEVLGFTGADAFVYEVAHLGELGGELAQAAGPIKVFCIGAGGLGPDVTDPPEVTGLPFDLDEITVEPRSLFQTSGTTGTPKLVQHGQRFFSLIPKVAAEYYHPGDQPRIRQLVLSATWHSGAQSAALMTWFSGGNLVVQFGLDLGNFLTTLERERITSTNVSPPMLYMLLDDPRLAETDLSTLRQITVSASAASPARLAQAIKIFGPALNIVYGMSEMPIITALPKLSENPGLPQRLSACGRPWGDARVEIRGASGAVVPTGEPGEIWVTGELVTEGYFAAPDVNAEYYVDGWLRTGDIGRLDPDGYLYILDRSKDMILVDVGSTMVFSRPLEDALTEHPDVRQAAVIGVPDEAMGEAVYAYVIRTPGATVTAEDLRTMVVEKLSAQWSPREVEFIDSFPLTEYGKVDKKQLRARYLAGAGGASAAVAS